MNKKYISLKATVITLSVILFPICNLLKGYFSYYDEFIGVFSLIYIVILWLENKLDKPNRHLFILLCLLTIIGFISNCLGKYKTSLFAIFVDILWLWKPTATFIAFQYLMKNSQIRHLIIKKLNYFAKFTVLFVFVVCVLGQLVDIGVTTKSITYFGLKQFGFFWDNSIQTGWLLFGAIMLLATNKVNYKAMITYLILAFIPLVLTASANVMGWVVIVILLLIMLKKNTTFKFYYLIILGICVSVFTYADVSNYLLSDSLRMTFIKTAVKLANRNAPWGVGFALFGSQMASKYYSPIYISLGWKNTWSFGTSSSFLNDNYFAMIIAELGWVGFAIFLLILYNIFKSVNSIKLSKYERVTAISTVICLIISMIGSATSKSAMGCFAFAVIGIVVSNKTEYLDYSNRQYGIEAKVY